MAEESTRLDHEVTPLGYPKRVLEPGQNYQTVTWTVASVVLREKQPKIWGIGFLFSVFWVAVFFVAVTFLLLRGVGIWGIDIPVAWGFAIVNFVWWIGIGHAGTFISAFLLLMHQEWRTSINRMTEAVTLFAVGCAALFPLFHLGRPWVFYWMMPYPDTMGLWPQFRSSLVWDLFAVATYFTVSLIFWYAGVVPDCATLRDHAKTRRQRIMYGILAMGWRNSATHWHHHQTVYLLWAGLATPLVVSVHSVVSTDFANTLVPGWHSTIFPPYFVAGAIYSGFAMVLNLLIPIRRIYGLESVITKRHLNNMGNILLATGWMVIYGYIIETFMAWYSGSDFEIYMVQNRTTGPYGWLWWVLVLTNVLVPQALWWRRVRTSAFWLFIVALSVNIGMWVERFVIVIASLHRDFVPSAWGMFYPTIWDWLTLFGSVGLFMALVFLLIRYIPIVSISELRELVQEKKEGSR